MRAPAFALLLIAAASFAKAPEAKAQITVPVDVHCAPAAPGLRAVARAGFATLGRGAGDDGSLWLLLQHPDGRFVLVFELPGYGLVCKAGGGEGWETLNGDGVPRPPPAPQGAPS